MASSSSNLVNILAEEIHKNKYKYRDTDKRCETYRIKYKDNDFFLIHDFKDDSMIYFVTRIIKKN